MMPAMKLKTALRSCARRHAMRFAQASRFHYSAASADCEGACRGGSVPSVVASQESDTLSVAGAANALSVPNMVGLSMCSDSMLSRKTLSVFETLPIMLKISEENASVKLSRPVFSERIFFASYGAEESQNSDRSSELCAVF